MSCFHKLKDGFAARYVLCLLFFLGFMVVFLLRVNINLAIVGMVKTTISQESNLTSSIGGCAVGNVTASSDKQTGDHVQGEFDWDEMQQSVILSSFFWGYLFFQIPGGRVAEVIGAKRVYGGAVLINGMLCFLLPFLAKLHWISLLIIRALQGLTQGVVFPALSAAVTLWVPISERARFMSFAVQGASLGTVVSMPLCGLLLKSWGWEAVFYVSGLLALLWCMAWWFFMFDTPEQHPRISPDEKQYIRENLPPQDRKRPPVPWKSVLTSWQFMLGCIAAIGNDWGYHTFITLVPKYLKGGLSFDVEQSSWLTSLPYLCQYIFASCYGTFMDFLLQKNKITVLTLRRVSMIVSQILPALSFIALSMAGCNATFAVTILTLAVSLIGAYSSGYFQNSIDVAPNYAGSLTGMMNAVGSITGIISTPVAGAVLQNDSTTEGWKVIFWISAAMYAICSLPYMICATAQVQPWNNPDEKTAKSVPVLMLSNVASSDVEDSDTEEALNKNKLM
ncbi:hypothetical protein L9F63_012136 [Diploptera punctata]|uniref:Major facilitator superfamily (MFS) profile domain-containing protein n=1 Tax=Diploptera punctata TaxID=6984 RepID=A0AAD8ADT5_DIPPU|nr:hypothetical protein L9F63_012136 [Diploptera punctata]